MSRLQYISSIFCFILFCTLSGLAGCNRETDEQLIAKMYAGLSRGNFRNKPEALKAISKLLSRKNPKVNDPNIVDGLITTGAFLLTNNGEWRDEKEARYVYNLLKRYGNWTVVDGLARKVLQDPPRRLRVLILSVKLGIPGTHMHLNRILNKHGDKKMAEDFLNSGSPELYSGGKRWAKKHGYSIKSGMGSHRASWGDF